MVPRPSEPWWPEAEFAFASNVGNYMAWKVSIDEALATAQKKAEAIVKKAGYAGKKHNLSPPEKEKQACRELERLGVSHPDCGWLLLTEADKCLYQPPILFFEN